MTRINKNDHIKQTVPQNYTKSKQNPNFRNIAPHSRIFFFIYTCCVATPNLIEPPNFMEISNLALYHQATDTRQEIQTHIFNTSVLRVVQRITINSNWFHQRYRVPKDQNETPDLRSQISSYRDPFNRAVSTTRNTGMFNVQV